MKKASIRFVFDRKKVATKKQKGLVQMEILHGGRRKFVSTGIKVFSDQWNNRYWVVNSLDSHKQNTALFDFKSELEDFLCSFSADTAQTFERVDRWLRQRESAAYDNDNFVEFCRQWIDERRDIRETTRKTQRKLIASLEEFGDIMYFSDLTKANINAYVRFLNGKYPNAQTACSYIKFLKACVNEALRQEKIKDNPFLGLKFKRGESSPDRYLTEEELQRIMQADMPTGSLENVRDLLIVQCYTGLAYSDLMSVDFSKAVRHGTHYVLTNERRKTGQGYYIVLLSPVMQVLRRRGFRLPMMSNQQYNMRLKMVADAAGVNKPIASHWLRRTCGYLLLNNGISIEMVARTLGHANIQTTQKIYAKIIDSTMDRAFSDLERRMIGNKIV